MKNKERYFIVFYNVVTNSGVAGSGNSMFGTDGHYLNHSDIVDALNIKNEFRSISVSNIVELSKEDSDDWREKKH